MMGIVLAIFIGFVPVDHNPYHWHMSCEAWLQRSNQIMLDPNLSANAKNRLIAYLRTKVHEPCQMNPVLAKTTSRFLLTAT